MPRKPMVAATPEDDNDDRDCETQARDGAPAPDLSFDPAELEAGGTAGSIPPGTDPFDPAALGLSQDFAGEGMVKQEWEIIKVEKPSKARVFRVHPTMRLRTLLLVIKEDNESYLVQPRMRQAMAGNSLCGVYTLLPCVTKNGTPFLWPIRMADSDGKWNVWHQSAWQIAEKAQARWTRMEANRDAGHYVACYDVRPPEQQQEPVWPELELRDWLERGFRGFTIDSLDHPVLKRLRLED